MEGKCQMLRRVLRGRCSWTKPPLQTRKLPTYPVFFVDRFLVKSLPWYVLSADRLPHLQQQRFFRRAARFFGPRMAPRINADLPSPSGHWRTRTRPMSKKNIIDDRANKQWRTLDSNETCGRDVVRGIVFLGGMTGFELPVTSQMYILHYISVKAVNK